MPLTKEHYQQIREQRAAIRRYIIRHLEQRPRGIVDLTFRQFGVGSAIVYQELRNLVSQGYVRAEGNTFARQNFLTEKGRELRKQYWLKSRSGKILSRRENGNRHGITEAKTGVATSLENIEALNRKPRNYLEAERLAWLKRKNGGT